MSVKFENGAITVAPNAKDMESRALWATMQRRISNMVQGVTEGYTKDLEIEGVGTVVICKAVNWFCSSASAMTFVTLFHKT